MTTAELRRQMKKQIDALPADRLPFAAEFLRYLDEYAGEKTAAEVAKIEAMQRRIDKAEDDIIKGRTRNWREVRRDV